MSSLSDTAANTSIGKCLQVLFSSIAALLGSPGQAAYAAANGELDALAAAWHRSGMPVTSVQWGGWAGAGMAASHVTQARNNFGLSLALHMHLRRKFRYIVNEGKGGTWSPWCGQGKPCEQMHQLLQERLQRTGLGAFTAAQGLAALGGVLGGVLKGAVSANTAADTIAATLVDWPTFLRRFSGRVPAVFAAFAAPAGQQQIAAPASVTAVGRPAGGLSSTPTAADVADTVRDAVRSIAGRAVGDLEPLTAAGAHPCSARRRSASHAVQP